MHPIAMYKELVLFAALLVWGLVQRRSRAAWLPWIGALLALELAVEVAAKVMGQRGINNHLLYNVYFAVEFGLIVWFLHTHWPQARTLRRTVRAAALLFAPVLVWDIWAHGSPHYLATNALIIGGFLLGGLTAQALFIMVRVSAGPVHREPLFWVLLSIMVYYLAFIPILGLYNYLVFHNPDLAMRIYSINPLLFVLRYGLVLLGLVMVLRQGPRGHDGQ